jgi:hypothetical protein
VAVGMRGGEWGPAATRMRRARGLRGSAGAFEADPGGYFAAAAAARVPIRMP